MINNINHHETHGNSELALVLNDLIDAVNTLNSSAVLDDVTVTGTAVFQAGLNTKQVVDNVHDTAPTEASLVSAFGAVATLGRGFIGTIDDNDGDTNGYIVWTSDASFYYIKGTKAT